MKHILQYTLIGLLAPMLTGCFTHSASQDVKAGDSDRFYPSTRSTSDGSIAVGGTKVRAETKAIEFRGTERGDVIRSEDVVDGTWVVIGNNEKTGGRVLRDTDAPHKGSPVYHFSAASGSVNRIEFSELFASKESLKGVSKAEVDSLVAIKSPDLGVDLGCYATRSLMNGPRGFQIV